MVFLTTLRAEREILIILSLRESVKEEELERIVKQNLRNSIFNFKNILYGLRREKFIEILNGIDNEGKTYFSYRIKKEGKVRLDNLDKKFNDEKLMDISNQQLKFNKLLVVITTILAVGVLFEIFTKIIKFYRIQDYQSIWFSIIGIAIVLLILKKAIKSNL